MHLVRSDVALHALASLVERTVVEGKDRFTSRQASELAGSLETEAAEALPDPSGISHGGYLTAFRGLTMRMYAAAKPKVAVDWGGLVQEVRSIPNTADRALVSCWTTELLHDLDRKGALDLLLAAEGDLTLIPDEIDRLTRLESIASAYKSLGERREASRAITAAFNATQLMGDDQRVWELQDRIIEKANAISPELASSLTPLIDDEVRRYSLEEKTYSRQLELRPADIAKQADEGFWVIQTNARAAFHLRRSLAGGRTGTQSADVASVWLLRSIGGGFPQVMQCIAWVCENAERAGWPESQRLEMSAAVLQAVSLARLLSAASAGEPVAAGESLQAGRLPRQVALVGVGDRTDALSRIAQWMLEDGQRCLHARGPVFLGARRRVLEAHTRRQPAARNSWVGRATRTPQRASSGSR